MLGIETCVSSVDVSVLQRATADEIGNWFTRLHFSPPMMFPLGNTQRPTQWHIRPIGRPFARPIEWQQKAAQPTGELCVFGNCAGSHVLPSGTTDLRVSVPCKHLPPTLRWLGQPWPVQLHHTFCCSFRRFATKPTYIKMIIHELASIIAHTTFSPPLQMANTKTNSEFGVHTKQPQTIQSIPLFFCFYFVFLFAFCFNPWLNLFRIMSTLLGFSAI